MKKLIFSLAIVVIGATSFTFFEGNISENKEVVIPEHVKKIIDSKCWGCHNDEAKSLKAKTKLKFDHLSDLSKTKLIGKLDEIAEEVEEGKMPPESFLKKNPDKKLSEEEVKTIIEWAHAASDELMQ